MKHRPTTTPDLERYRTNHEFHAGKAWDKHGEAVRLCFLEGDPLNHTMRGLSEHWRARFFEKGGPPTPSLAMWSMLCHIRCLLQTIDWLQLNTVLSREIRLCKAVHM